MSYARKLFAKRPFSTIQGKPYITVSAKGISNGLSDIPNDGADFGPDTMQNATSPNQYGPPYSNTNGIQEAVNYAYNNGIGKVILKAGVYPWYPQPTSGTVYIPSGITLEGEGSDKTIIQVQSSTEPTNIPIATNGDNIRITGITFDMGSNFNSQYTPSAIFITNPNKHIEIDHCRFINQALAWFIQFQATFSSTSPPSGYIEDVKIHDNYINANIPSGQSADECIVVSNSKNVDIYNNTFVFDGVNMTNGFFAIYDYTRHTHVFNNRFIAIGGGHSPLMNVSDTFDFHFEGNEVIEDLEASSGTGPFVIGVQNSSKYVYIEGNMIMGSFGPNLAGFGALVGLGLGPNAVANGSGGPDGNLSQNSGWNDYLVIKNNYAIGLYNVFQFEFSGNQNFTYLEVSDNVFGTLRQYFNPINLLYYASQNQGTIIWRNNIEIGDILIGSANVGGGASQLEIAAPSGYTVQQLIIEGNRFPNALDFASTTAFNNISLSNIQNLIFRNNIMFNNSTISSPTSIAPWYQLSNITTPIVGPNYDGSSGKVLEQMFPLSSVSGTTAGTVNIYAVNFYETKKYIIVFSGYENDTTANQTVSFPFPFSSYAVITANSTGLTISASTTGITITSPNSTTTYSGVVIVEGY